MRTSPDGVRFVTLEVRTFCRSVFVDSGEQGPVAWRLVIVIELTARWKKFPTPKVDRMLFISGGLKAMMSDGGNLPAVTVDNVSFVPSGSSGASQSQGRPEYYAFA